MNYISPDITYEESIKNISYTINNLKNKAFILKDRLNKIKFKNENYHNFFVIKL